MIIDDLFCGTNFNKNRTIKTVMLICGRVDFVCYVAQHREIFMYYEEKIINGILMFRTSTEGDFSQCSINEMSSRIIVLQDKVKSVEKLLNRSIREAKEQGYTDGKYYEKNRMSELLGLET